MWLPDIEKLIPSLATQKDHYYTIFCVFEKKKKYIQHLWDRYVYAQNGMELEF